MLALVGARLEELRVDYEYFDGSTSAPDREKAIQRFQNEEKCRVFLISLKAGGVGLNNGGRLCVYIVDPWWNPRWAAGHRPHAPHGTNKNIFAYRMICKDTVEDKILQLQEKKRLFAADLITDDSGMQNHLPGRYRIPVQLKLSYFDSTLWRRWHRLCVTTLYNISPYERCACLLRSYLVPTSQLGHNL